MIGGVLKCVKRMVLKTIRAVKRRVGWIPPPPHMNIEEILISAKEQGIEK